jgi:hypothetical protein
MLLSVVQVDPESHGLKTSDVLKIANGKDQGYTVADHETLREAVEVFCDSTIDRVSSQMLGTRLSHFRNRVVDQMAFDCTLRRGANFWFIVQSGGRGGRGVPVSPDLKEQFFTTLEDSDSKKGIAASGENTSTTSTTSTPNSIDGPDLDSIGALFQ